MKNRRNIIIAFLLCAALLVGVGYATISGTFIVDGEVSFDAQYDNELEGTVFFNGTAYKVNNQHQEVDSDEITFNLASGTMEAMIKAHFVGNSTANPGFMTTGVAGNNVLVAGVVFEIMIDNTDGTEDLTLVFEEAMVEGAVGTQSPFTVTSKVMDSSGMDGATANDLTDQEVTVLRGNTKTVYLHVQMALADLTKDVDTTAFKVSVVVNKVEEA